MLIGSSQAFEKLVKEYQAPIRRLFLNLTLGDEMLSEDLAQDTFLKAFNGWNSFRHLSGTKTWLFRIAYNVFYDYRRSLHIAEDIDSLETSHPHYETDPSLRADIYKAMQKLSDIEKICVTLSLVEDQPIKTVVRVTGLNENTVKSHIRRGREKMANFLKANDYGR